MMLKVRTIMSIGHHPFTSSTIKIQKFKPKIQKEVMKIKAVDGNYHADPAEENQKVSAIEKEFINIAFK